MIRTKILTLGIGALLIGLLVAACTTDEQRIGSANAAAAVSASNTTSVERTEAETISVFDLRAGDCFTDDAFFGDEAGSVRAVPCSGALRRGLAPAILIPHGSSQRPHDG